MRHKLNTSVQLLVGGLFLLLPWCPFVETKLEVELYQIYQKMDKGVATYDRTAPEKAYDVRRFLVV